MSKAERKDAEITKTRQDAYSKLPIASDPVDILRYHLLFLGAGHYDSHRDKFDTPKEVARARRKIWGAILYLAKQRGRRLVIQYRY